MVVSGRRSGSGMLLQEAKISRESLAITLIDDLDIGWWRSPDNLRHSERFILHRYSQYNSQSQVHY